MNGGNRRKDIMERVKIKEAAKILAVSEQFVRVGIQRGTLPIGSAVKINNSTKFTYHIPRERLETYLKGGDIVNGVAATTERTIK